ncbi:MAG: hypothetical protein LBT25_11195 [Candidatus Symbiothrix sp.]|nr:hypothetical protein [Candidatus Symbiothrix sp.]
MKLFFISIFIFLFIIYIYPSISFLKKGLPKKFRALRGEYMLSINEMRHIENLSKLYKNQFYTIALWEETVKLYIEVRRELQRQNKWNKQQSFIKPLLERCRKVVLQKLGFIDENKKVTVPEESIIRLINEKSSIVEAFSKEENENLYSVNANLWEARYAYLTHNFDQNKTKEFYNDICELDEISNSRVMVARKIYFQAYQFLADYNRVYSLICYLHYLNVKTEVNSKHRIINKNFSKILFPNELMEKKFLEIGDRLLEDEDLDSAIENVKTLYVPTRKKIQLDILAIKEADNKQIHVAELLEKYLNDEKETVPLKTSSATQPPVQPSVQVDYTVSENEFALFKLFENKNYSVNKKEIDIFARKKGAFRDSLIQTINEKYYEELDDLLIEEEEDDYLLNEVYYEQIKRRW